MRPVGKIVGIDYLNRDLTGGYKWLYVFCTDQALQGGICGKDILEGVCRYVDK